LDFFDTVTVEDTALVCDGNLMARPRPERRLVIRPVAYTEDGSRLKLVDASRQTFDFRLTRCVSPTKAFSDLSVVKYEYEDVRGLRVFLVSLERRFGMDVRPIAAVMLPMLAFRTVRR
jgi:hypothetical protein